MIQGDAVVFTNALLHTSFAKTCHGLLRGGNRFNILGVIDNLHEGKDAGEVIDGKHRGVRVFKSVKEFLRQSPHRPRYFVVGVAFPGGQLPESCRDEIILAMENGMSIVCGLHQFLSDNPVFRSVAEKAGVDLIDIRKPSPSTRLHFWNGDIFSVKTPKIAVLGTDCAIGKRTTCRFLMEVCNDNGIKTEMIYTGQTGWMQGYKHGFIFDATPNDFVGGEIERVILECEKAASPDLMVIEGQSSLSNPSGPCGSEFLLSGNVKGVLLQHAPARIFFEDLEVVGCKIPPLEKEIELIRMYGAEVLAITLNEERMENTAMVTYAKQLEEKLSIPVNRPLKDGIEPLIPVIRKFIGKYGIL
jgi:uncharacterized NAD-dependent epimerase/dehydratase family protein